MTATSPPSATAIDRLARLDTTTVSDALDFLALPGATVGVLPLWACAPIVGRASTVQLGPKRDAAPTVHLISPVIAAIAAPDRPVLCLESDGSAMYTISALWSHARECLDITTVVYANHAYDQFNGYAIGVLCTL